MTITEMINRLEAIKAAHGDLSIVGGYLSDDIPPKDVVIINEHGCDIKDEGGDIAGVFIL